MYVLHPLITTPMNLIARFHRWRLAETTYWLQYESQIHHLLLADSQIATLCEVLRDQIENLDIAYRSRDLSELNATYSYRGTRFYDVSDRFTLCRVIADNATGLVQFGGGMLSEIRLTPNVCVANPQSFRLECARVTEVFVPTAERPIFGAGWIADMEEKGILARFGAPRNAVSAISDHPAHQQYADLFAGCAEASINLSSETFHFLAPVDSGADDAPRSEAALPILDLREFGGLVIMRTPTGAAEVCWENGSIVWSEPNLAGAIQRLHSEFAKFDAN